MLRKSYIHNSATDTFYHNIIIMNKHSQKRNNIIENELSQTGTIDLKRLSALFFFAGSLETGKAIF